MIAQILRATEESNGTRSLVDVDLEASAVGVVLHPQQKRIRVLRWQLREASRSPAHVALRHALRLIAVASHLSFAPRPCEQQQKNIAINTLTPVCTVYNNYFHV